MMLCEDQEKIKALLADTITLLLKNGLAFKTKFSVEALIGITLDDDKVFLVSINKNVDTGGKVSMVCEDETLSQSRKHVKECYGHKDGADCLATNSESPTAVDDCHLEAGSSRVTGQNGPTSVSDDSVNSYKRPSDTSVDHGETKRLKRHDGIIDAQEEVDVKIKQEIIDIDSWDSSADLVDSVGGDPPQLSEHEHQIGGVAASRATGDSPGAHAALLSFPGFGADQTLHPTDSTAIQVCRWLLDAAYGPILFIY